MKTKFYFFTILFFVSIMSFATGPSNISSEIRPIAMNENGDTLCKTRFLENWMGSHSYPTISYGIAIIRKNKILEVFSKEISFEKLYADTNNPNIGKMIDDCEKWFYTEKNIPYDILFTEEDIQLKINLKDYPIKDLSKYEINKEYTVKEFKHLYNIDLTKKKQLALLGAKSKTKEVENNPLVLQYNFGNVLFIQNGDVLNCFAEDYSTPIYFNYPKSLENLEVNYDCSEVTGLIFIKKKQK